MHKIDNFGRRVLAFALAISTILVADSVPIVASQSKKYVNDIYTIHSNSNEQNEDGVFVGEGTEESPYLISTLDELIAIEHDSDAKYYKLTNDIDLSSLCGEDIGSFIPIGGSHYFNGCFDGDGHAIKNLYIFSNQQGELKDENDFTISNIGLFTGVLEGSIIKNLTVEGEIHIDDNVEVYNIGGIVGGIVSFDLAETHLSSESARIENCVSDVAIYCESSKWASTIGGVVGDALYKKGIAIDNCVNNGNIEVLNAYNVGGIVGESYKNDVTNCINNGVITVKDGAGARGIYGGIIGGMTSGKIESSINHGSIKINEAELFYAGGIVGECERDVIISECMNDADIIGYGQIGGIVGELCGSTVSESYNAGGITSISGFAGGIAGFSDGYCTDSSENSDEASPDEYYEPFYIKDCYNTGKIMSNGKLNYKQDYVDGDKEYTLEEVLDSCVGGICAVTVRETYEDNNPVDSISNCYNIGLISGEDFGGGIVGDNDGTIVKNSYSLEGIVNTSSNYGTLLAKSDFCIKEKFVSWDFEKVWEMGQNRPVFIYGYDDGLYMPEVEKEKNNSSSVKTENDSSSDRKGSSSSDKMDSTSSSKADSSSSDKGNSTTSEKDKSSSSDKGIISENDKDSSSSSGNNSESDKNRDKSSSSNKEGTNSEKDIGSSSSVAEDIIEHKGSASSSSYVDGSEIITGVIIESDEIKPSKVITIEKNETAIVGDGIIIQIPEVDPSEIYLQGKAGSYKVITDPLTGEKSGFVIGNKKGTIKLYKMENDKRRLLCVLKIEVPKLKKTLKLNANKKKKIKLTGTRTIPDRWETSDENVAIYSDGYVKAIGGGTAIISAIIGEHRYSCGVTVKGQPYIVPPKDASSSTTDKESSSSSTDLEETSSSKNNDSESIKSSGSSSEKDYSDSGSRKNENSSSEKSSASSSLKYDNSSSKKDNSSSDTKIAETSSSKNTSSSTIKQYEENWYEDYDYSLDNEKHVITLTKYMVSDNKIVSVPANEEFDGEEYSVSLNGAVFRDNKRIESVNFEDGVILGGCSSLFNGCTSLKKADLRGVDTSGCKTMANMFYGCTKIQSIYLSKCDIGGVLSMAGMFSGCRNLTWINGLNELDTSNVTNMRYMFYHCNRLTSLDLSSFDMSKCKKCSSMFERCKNLKEIKTPKVLNSEISVDLPCTMNEFSNGQTYSVDYTDLMQAPVGTVLIKKENDVTT